jgi:signal transduction histidine kinase/ActR/RegA family two-component response regulator
LILSVIVGSSIVTWWTASIVQRHQAARSRAEAAERDMQSRLVRTLEREREARAAAERSNRLKDEFLATLSHELRTPLNAMLGWTNLLLSGHLGEKDARRGLEAIDRNSRLQAQLIEDLLDMSRIEAGKVRLDLQAVDLALIVESALAAAGPAAQAAGVALERRIDPSAHVLLQGDPARLQQVLWNLLSNAIKFTPRGGQIVVSAAAAEGGATVAVTDTGIGIKPEQMDRIFDRFAQADGSTTRRYGGLGLGLSIARQLAELHGGTVTAESAGEDRGATFTVSLPVDPGRPTAVPSAAETSLVEQAAVAQARQAVRGRRVLVVDDHADATAFVGQLLRGCGAEVATADSAAGAMDCLDRAAFDLLVSDIGMPGRDGYALMRQVRRRYPDLPAIALTAYVREDDEQRAVEAGFDRHIGKPIDPDELMVTIAEVLAASRQAPRQKPAV